MLTKDQCKVGTKVILNPKSQYFRNNAGQLPKGMVGTIVKASQYNGPDEYNIQLQWTVGERICTNSYTPRDLNLFFDTPTDGEFDYEIL